MNKRQTDLAFELAETWINGDRSDVIRTLKREQPIVAIALAFQISAELPVPSDTGFQNAMDRHAGDNYD